MATVKAVLRKEKTVTGKQTINICVSIKKERKYYSLKKQVNPLYWDSAKGLVKPKEDNAKQINRLIIKNIDEVNHIFHAYEMGGKILSIEQFHQEYKKDKIVSSLYFIKFFEDTLSLQTATLSKGSMAAYRTTLNKLNDFAPKVLITQINYDFLVRFESYLIQKYRLNSTSLHKSLKTVRTYYYVAMKMGLVTENPFRQYKLKAGTSNRTYLSEDDLLKIINVELINEGELRAKNMFIFQCFTGLRFSDLIALKWRDIEKDLITIDNIKTKQRVTIPLIDRAKAVLDSIERDVEKETIFLNISNQRYNEHLHTIEKKLKLSKALTSHVARHTFATLALTKGIPLEVVSSLLGHTNTKTTQIYGKIIDVKKKEEMKKLNF